MKLTNYIRDAFITSVMNDVPTIDYAAQAQAVFMPAYIDTLPKLIQAAWKDNISREYLHTKYATCCHQSFVVPAPEGGRSSIPTPPSVVAALAAITAAYIAQSDKMTALRRTVKGATYACNTTKQLRELLPEFERYLPAEEEKTLRTLPVVQNIVADFVKAGWPDKKKGAKA